MLGKKGSILDMMTAIVLLLVTSIIIILVVYVWTQLTCSGSACNPNNIQTFANITANNSVAQSVVSGVSSSYSLVANGIVLLFFMTCASAILLAFFVKSHPVFAIIPLIFLIPMVIVSGIFANFWQSLVQNSFLNLLGNSTFIYVTYLFQYLPIITLTLSIVLMIVMYAKPTAGTGVY